MQRRNYFSRVKIAAPGFFLIPLLFFYNSNIVSASTDTGNVKTAKTGRHFILLPDSEKIINPLTLVLDLEDKWADRLSGWYRLNDYARDDLVINTGEIIDLIKEKYASPEASITIENYLAAIEKQVRQKKRELCQQAIFSSYGKRKGRGLPYPGNLPHIGPVYLQGIKHPHGMNGEW